MARDYTKYAISGLGENLNKRQLVFEIVKDYIEKNRPSYDELTSVFQDQIQGSKGFIRKSSEINDPKRFKVNAPLQIKYGVEVVVSNQWGTKNIDAFLNLAEQLNYSVTMVKNEIANQEEDGADSNSPTTDHDGASNYLLIRAHTNDTGDDLQLNKCIVFESHDDFALCFSLSSDGDGVIDNWNFYDRKTNVYGSASSPWEFEEFTDEDEEWTDHESIEDFGYDANEIALKLDEIRVAFVDKYLNDESQMDLLNSAAVSSAQKHLFKKDENAKSDDIVVYEDGDKSSLPELWRDM